MTAERVAFVESLPRRVAHVTHALMAAADISMGNGPGPFTAAEVCVYDGEAISVRSTAAALREARKRGLVVHFGYWTPTNLALDHRRAFEDRYLRETGAAADLSVRPDEEGGTA